jgi:hypothetical protein
MIYVYLYNTFYIDISQIQGSLSKRYYNHIRKRGIYGIFVFKVYGNKVEPNDKFVKEGVVGFSLNTSLPLCLRKDN